MLLYSFVFDLGVFYGLKLFRFKAALYRVKAPFDRLRAPLRKDQPSILKKNRVILLLRRIWNKKNKTL